MSTAQKQICRGHCIGGFTLLEILIVCTITAVVLTSVLAVLPKWMDSFEDNNAHAADNDRVRDVFARMCDDIRESGQSCPDWNLYGTSDTITFNRCAGYDGTTKFWGEPITYSFDTDNGTLVRTSGEESRILCHNVTGLSFTPDGNNVEITLVVSSTGTQERVLTSRLSGLVNTRN